MPTFTDDVTVISELTADPWDGDEGGVLAFIADGTVTLDAGVNVSGQGFLAGNNLEQGGNIANTMPNNRIHDAIANGGGAGNGVFAQNNGGGGGANCGAGGRGGFQVTSPAGLTGLGGAALGGFYNNTENRIFLGGWRGCQFQ